MLSPNNSRQLSSPQHNHTLAYPLSAAKDFFSHRGSVTVRKNAQNDNESPNKNNPLDLLNNTVDFVGK